MLFLDDAGYHPDAEGLRDACIAALTSGLQQRQRSESCAAARACMPRQHAVSCRRLPASPWQATPAAALHAHHPGNGSCPSPIICTAHWMCTVPSETHEWHRTLWYSRVKLNGCISTAHPTAWPCSVLCHAASILSRDLVHPDQVGLNYTLSPNACCFLIAWQVSDIR